MLRTDRQTDEVHSYNPLPTLWRGIKKRGYGHLDIYDKLLQCRSIHKDLKAYEGIVWSSSMCRSMVNLIQLAVSLPLISYQIFSFLNCFIIAHVQLVDAVRYYQGLPISTSHSQLLKTLAADKEVNIQQSVFFLLNITTGYLYTQLPIYEMISVASIS